MHRLHRLTDTLAGLALIGMQLCWFAAAASLLAGARP
jgi:hypothetical protein